MSFQLSSTDIHLVDGHILTASCEGGGGWHHATLDLNDFLGNKDGVFDVHSANFSHTAESVSIIVSQDKVTLVASLRKWDGSLNPTQHLDLSKYIVNDSGALRSVVYASPTGSAAALLGRVLRVHDPPSA
ncbi:hypothetical protein BGX34_000733 [Mortierella sp. NVP85]|nr:hypothetical protein BGX34_000733 [Mortierella sp. NVP85]